MSAQNDWKTRREELGYQIYSPKEIEKMKEQGRFLPPKDIGKIIIDGKGTEKEVERLPFPNPEILGEDAKRPSFVTYEEGLAWNKLSQQHTEAAMSFTQEYAKRIVEPKHGNRIMVVNLSDLHWGHMDTDYELLDHLLKLVETTPDTYCIFGWNILDAAIPAQYPDGVMWSGQTAQEQVYTFRDKIKQLDKLNKVLGAIGDAHCHEGWTRKKTGIMIYRELFEGTNIPLLLNGGYLEVQVKDELYRTALFHRTRYWSTLNKLHGGERIMDRMADAEIVFTGHFHFAAVGQSQRFNPPFTKDTAVVTAGTCKTKDKWQRGFWGNEGEKGGQAIILWADKHKFQTIFDLDIGTEIMLNGVK